MNKSKQNKKDQAPSEPKSSLRRKNPPIPGVAIRSSGKRRKPRTPSLRMRSDYRVMGNTLMSRGPPVFQRGQGGTTTIAHREYLGDVTGSTAFTLAAYNINPGLYDSFPWLSALATNYESYQVLGMIFEFKSTSGNAVSSANTALGTVIMATDYDTYDGNFTSKQAMEAYQYACSGSPTRDLLHPIECKSSRNPLGNLYIRSGAPYGDDRLYDLGRFQIATVGMQGSYTVGELWVTYHIKLFKPRIAGSLGVNLPCTHYTSLTSSGGGSFYSPSLRPGSTFSLTFPTNNSFVFNRLGTFLVNLSYIGSTTINAVNITSLTGITYHSILDNGNAAGLYSGSTNRIITLFLDVNSLTNAIQFTTPSTTGPESFVDLFVVQTPSLLTSINPTSVGKRGDNPVVDCGTDKKEHPDDQEDDDWSWARRDPERAARARATEALRATPTRPPSPSPSIRK